MQWILHASEESGGCIMPESYFGKIVGLLCLEEGGEVKKTFGEV
jgi:hypothetical protein